jgi:hypothetical protein
MEHLPPGQDAAIAGDSKAVISPSSQRSDGTMCAHCDYLLRFNDDSAATVSGFAAKRTTPTAGLHDIIAHGSKICTQYNIAGALPI